MKYITIIVILIIFFGGAVNGLAQEKNIGKERSQERVENLIERANSLYEEKSYLDAKDIYEAVLKLDPDNALVLFYLELIPEKIKEKEKQEKEQQVYVLYHQAISLYKDKQYKTALEKFKEIESILLDYERTKYYISRINEDIQQEDKKQEDKLEEAKSLQKISQNKDKEKIDALLEEAYRLYEKDKYLEAKAFYEEVIELDRANTVALLYLERIPDKIKEKEKYQLEQKVQSIYEQAFKLYQDKRDNEALEKFKEIEKTCPDYRRTRYFISDIPKDIQKTRQRLETLDLSRKKRQEQGLIKKYNEAFLLYKKKKYQDALDKFNEIDQLYPGYKDTARYRERIPQDIKLAEVQSLLVEAESLYKDKQYSKARIIYEKALISDPNNSTALLQIERLPGKIEEQKRRQLEEKAQFTYKHALALYRDKQYQLALDKFKEVKAIISNYENTETYITRIFEDIRREEEDAFKERNKIDYNDAVTLYRNKQYLAALNKFKEISANIPNYKKSDYYIKRILNEINEEKDQKTKTQALKEEAAELKYNEAASLYLNKNYEPSLEKFKKLDEFYPNYKDTFIYMHRISKKLEEEKLDSLLKEAEVLYAEGRYSDARPIYEVILKFNPENKIALVYLDRISNKLQKEGKILALYNEAVSLYDKQQYQTALRKFQEVKNVLPHYDKIDYYLELIPKTILQEREQ